MFNLLTSRKLQPKRVVFDNVYKYLTDNYGDVDDTLCYICIEAFIGDIEQLVQSRIDADFSFDNASKTLSRFPWISALFDSNTKRIDDFKKSLGKNVKNVVIRLVARDNICEYCTEIEIADGIVLIIT